ncbi:MAG: ribosomal protein S18-alanine N-acetyltransferase [Clostridia bacterium]|nr:ribosomal protein S18-alanine N-acetyltransferase [Clostridia bacterium]
MIRIATKEDIKDIAQIENICFKDAWSELMLVESLDNGCIMLVAEKDNKVIGYAGIYPSGDITNIAVLPEVRGNGYGKKLVENLIEIARKNNIDTIFLEVRQSNRLAIKLYEKCGFKLISKRTKYYKDGEDALIYAFGGV